jgi:hypothetical protein
MKEFVNSTKQKKDGGIHGYQRDALKHIKEWNAFVLAERKRLSKK